ncbi:hypothetical protein RRF57_011505 [Xylaria bambusicola]|uniref:Cytochrome b mRNA-processing protein 4 n=1 Tax=Xylaria bambusicola TaxID=326684 RepID=A0AAN7UY96_9PEZI
MWVQPTEEELFKRYNPELQKKSLERRYEKQKEFDDFVVRLKEYSKSDKPSTFDFSTPSTYLFLESSELSAPVCQGSRKLL